MAARALGLLALAGAAGGCIVHQHGGWPVAAGGSVTDFDRSPTGAPCCEDTAMPAGAWDSIGIADTDGGERQARVASRIEPITPGPDRQLVAGPPELGRLVGDADTIRALQRALADRGYYQGPVDGVASPALTDALARFQIDRRLPATGLLDGPTEGALRLARPGR